MQEAFIHYVWLTGSFRAIDIQTTDSQTLTIIKRGYSHNDAGPDFSNAQIRINDQLWAGHVELHLVSSDWYAHNHHLDPGYDATILHVCYQFDRDVFRTDGSKIPCLELGPLIDSEMQHRYLTLVGSLDGIPCRASLSDVPEFLKSQTLRTMAMARLEEKHSEIMHTANHLNYNWNEILYREIAAAFGLRINKEPFRQLSKMLPYKLISRYVDKPIYVEALLFGTSGFLRTNPWKDSYINELESVYQFLVEKHQLQAMEVHLWKFLRLRPANFPTLRIAQFSAFLQNSPSLINAFQGASAHDVTDFLNVEVSDYWERHYRFGEASKPSKKPIGKSTKNLILINAMAPVMFAHAKWKDDVRLETRAIRLLEDSLSEKNRVTAQLSSLGFPMQDALHSQGALHLVKNYCNFKRCLQCSIGHHLLKTKGIKQ